MSKRNFYKTVFQVEVLSEEPFNLNASLDDIHYQIIEGNCSGKTTASSVTTLNGKQAAKELQKQGSDPEFFNLDTDGNDLDNDLVEEQ